MTDAGQPKAVDTAAPEDRAAPPPETSTANSRRRTLGVGVLVTLASLMLAVAVLATWIDRVFLDSQTWADTSTEALQQPAVRTALSAYIVDQIYAGVDVPKTLQQALPKRAKALAGPLAVTGQPYVERAIAAGLDRPRVVELWRKANLRAHSQLMTVLNGGSSRLSTARGEVAIDLRPLVGELSSTLTARSGGAVTLPPDAGKIVLLRSNQLSTAQTVVKLLRFLAFPLMLLSLVVFAAAVYVSRTRRTTLRTCAFGMLAAGLVLVVVRRVIGGYLIDSLTQLPDVRDAAHVTWWIATDRLGNANITLCSIALLLLVGTWFAGPGRRATSARQALTPYLRDPVVAYGGYALVLLVLLVWAPVNVARDPVLIAIIAALGAIGLETLRRIVQREFPDATHRDLGGRLLAASKHAYASVRPAPEAAPSRYEALDRLASLHDRGALSDQEFAAEKAAVLEQR